ncbi:zinc ABC transporter substrate-binding protein [Maliponia aquimaris]|uniref:High-affinity zinc uptake system protein ZnuA n=1 Tax=Maliponia aquimaris TaxID=1673631 RepID=A0A238KK21_9RHOB|nr:zinc ABC transporter substrate-binding protein [Maliponia aquimaris]SMX42452.1 High-affinity zinc uptake system protein ZnuA precursor [Maliponia aquimaris]
MLRTLLLTACFALPVAARAEVPKVVTDIGPVESLTALVMQGLGTPERLLPPGASPHEMALRPSQARLLSEADLVIWVGPDLTPQLARQIEALAPEARSLPLAKVAGTHLLPAREAGLFAHDHGDEDHGHDDHAHDDGHAAHDSHPWLDPDNALVWLGAIASALAEADPDNAAAYNANAAQGAAEIATARAEAGALLAPLADVPLGVGHDALQYFERSFGLTVLGAVSDSDSATPGPARLAALRDTYAATPPACLLTEPGTDPRLLGAVADAGIPVVELDSLGAGLPQGPGLYPALLRDLAARIAECAGR